MAETTPAVRTAVVVDRREPAPGIIVLGLRAPELAASSRAGQFVMVATPGGERAAVALGVYEASGSRISLMLVTVGPRTAVLAGQHVGASLELLGPLGNGFDIDALGDDVAIVAGGVGLASLLLLAERLKRRGRRARLYYGARTSAALVDIDLFTQHGIDVTLATDDGTRAHHGYVTDLLTGTVRHSAIAACGPTPMLRSVARIAAQRGLRAQLSLEEAFACGVGACWGCVVPHAATPAGLPEGLIGAPPSLPNLAHEVYADGAAESGEYAYVRICREGPVFWAHELRW